MILGRTSKVVGITVASLGLVAACSGGSDPDPTSTGSPTASSSASASASTTTSATTGSIDGTWKSDAGQLVAENTANLGDTGSMTCSGPIRLTFRTNGTFKHGGAATCSVGAQSVSATILSEGDYTTSGDELILSNTRSTGTLDIPGGAVPFPAGIGDGTGTFNIAGDTLTLTFTDPSVGTVTQEWQRASS